jgi:hypothetical protein
MLTVALLAGALATTPAAASAPAADPGRPSPPSLLSSSPLTQGAEPGLGRGRSAQADASPLSSGRAVRVTLNLFPGTTPVASLDPQAAVGQFSHWSGVLEGVADSAVTVVRRGPSLAALITTKEATYTVTERGRGVAVHEVTGSRKPYDDLVLDVSGTGESTTTSPSDATSDGVASIIDVLVAYTPATLADLGSVAAVESLAALSVAVTNDAYAASGIAVTANLVGTMPSDDAGVADGQTLHALADTDDGMHDEVHAARDDLGADLVSLLVAGGNYCGAAYYPSSAAAATGFSVVAHACAVHNLSFPHELGHNLGAGHDRYMEASNPVFPGGHGFVDVTAGWRTIMAYGNACTAQGKTCPRLPRFSNPDQTHQGAPLGVPLTATTAADNRSAHGFYATSVSTYRPRSSTVTVPGAVHAATFSLGAAARTATVAWSPPVTDGGAAITSYRIGASVQGSDGAPILSDALAGARSLDLTGLVEGASYDLTVQAVNPVGPGLTVSGIVSVPVALVPTPPDAPQAVTATAADGSAVVAWAGPGFDGGSPVTGYRVTATTGEATCTTTGSTSCTVTGLTNGTAYAFTVTATSSAGTGPASDPSDSVTPAGVPGAPAAVTAAPVDANGSPVTRYTVVVSPGGQTATVPGTSTTAELGGLTNGTAYTFAVTATNSVGTSPRSTPSSSVIPMAADNAPPELVSFDFTPKTVDVSTGPASVVVTARVTDATGAQDPTIVFGSTDTSQTAGFGAMARTSGTAKDGTYSRSITIPQDAAPGTWSALLYPLRDTVGNDGLVGPPAGYPTTLIVSASTPTLTEPAATDPLPTEPLPTEPVSTPLPTDPVPIDPVPTDPVPIDPVPTDPVPIDPVPTDPVPIDPVPIDPVPIDPVPIDPVPIDPVPIDPVPIDPVPIDPVPIKTLPTEPPATESPAPIESELSAPSARSIEDACPTGRAPANPFTDVAAGSTHERAISCLLWWEVANGRTAISYAPADGVTRDAMAAFVARTILAAKPGSLPDNPPDVFGDDNGSVHQRAINQLAAVGVVGGTGDGNYSPGAVVNRGQMAKFLANAAKHVMGQPLPSDRDLFSDDNTSPFQDDINRVARAGLTGGRADGTYDPAGPVLRDQMGSFLARTLDLFVDNGAQTPA